MEFVPQIRQKLGLSDPTNTTPKGTQPWPLIPGAEGNSTTDDAVSLSPLVAADTGYSEGAISDLVAGAEGYLASARSDKLLLLPPPRHVKYYLPEESFTLPKTVDLNSNEATNLEMMLERT